MFETEVKLSYVLLKAVHAPRFQIFIVLGQCDGEHNQESMCSCLSKYKDILVERKLPKIPQLDDPFYTKLMGNGDIPYGCFLPLLLI